MIRAKPDIWMPLFWGSYFADTRDFSAEEHGAYLCLIGHYWQTGGPILNDQKQLLRAACLTGKRSVRVLNRVLSKFLVEGQYLRHKRIDEELAIAYGRKGKAVEKAKKAADARWGKDAGSNAPSMPEAVPGAMLEQCPIPLPVPLQVRTTDLPSGTVHPTHKESPNSTPHSPPRGGGRKKDLVDDLELPEEIRTSIMEAAWADWRTHLKQKGSKLTLLAAQRQLAKLAEWGHARAIAAIGYSIEQNWQGIYEEKKTHTGGGSRSAADTLKDLMNTAVRNQNEIDAGGK